MILQIIVLAALCGICATGFDWLRSRQRHRRKQRAEAELADGTRRPWPDLRHNEDLSGLSGSRGGSYGTGYSSGRGYSGGGSAFDLGVSDGSGGDCGGDGGGGD